MELWLDLSPPDATLTLPHACVLVGAGRGEGSGGNNRGMDGAEPPLGADGHK